MGLEQVYRWAVTILIPAIFIELVRRELNQKGPKLSYYSSNVITHRVTQPYQAPGQPPPAPFPQPLFLNSVLVVIRNVGNVVATNVEISHPQAPEHFELTPAIQHEAIRNPNSRRMTIKIPTIAPKETITISYLFGPVANWNDILEYIRSDGGLAKKINTDLLRVFPNWFNLMLLLFLILGVMFLGYIIWWIYPPIAHCVKWLVAYPRAVS